MSMPGRREGPRGQSSLRSPLSARRRGQEPAEVGAKTGHRLRVGGEVVGTDPRCPVHDDGPRAVHHETLGAVARPRPPGAEAERLAAGRRGRRGGIADTEGGPLVGPAGDVPLVAGEKPPPNPPAVTRPAPGGGPPAVVP